MTTTVHDFLTGFGVGGALRHKEETIQDLMDAMTPEHKDFLALIVGAALDGGELDGESAQRYIALSDIDKHLIDFVVGNVEAEGMAHSDMADDLDDFLAHYGVKGMKWGVIRDTATSARNKVNAPGSLSRSSANTSAGRKAARGAVESGNATAKQAHLAALKSTGHRAINALGGDKTFWRRTAITAGVATAAFAGPVAAAYVLPAGVLSAIGGSSAGVAVAGINTTTFAPYAIYSTAQIGQYALGMAGAYAMTGAAVVGTAANVVGNTARAVAGNSLINRSYDRVGKAVVDRQKRGRDRVAGALKTVTGIRDKDLRHSEPFSEVFAILNTNLGGMS